MPSMVWRAGQDRRMAMIASAIDLLSACVLDIGCGLGAYSERMTQAGAVAIGTEIELARAAGALERGIPVACAVAEALPFADCSFDAVLSHEVLEHVADDRLAAQEMARVLRAGGRAVVFVPNRWWPFETHGVRWRGDYRFGNFPLVNYLPDVLRNRLAPHVRVYTGASLRQLFDGLPVGITVSTQIFPGFDKLLLRRPLFGQLARRALYALEGTPARRLGLSHLMVVERTGAPAAGSSGEQAALGLAGQAEEEREASGSSG
ncbi:MAG: methyltransferase domain-containing protein [Anaerolineae bacterium]